VIFKLFEKKVNNQFAWQDREWIAESVEGKENLLITIGDSWTWGDSLGCSIHTENNKSYRYENFYTGILSKKLNADWLMLAKCGTNNRWIMARYSEICNSINKGFYKNYNKVFVHVNFTEQFRDIESFSHDIKDDYDSIGNFAEYYFASTVLNNLKKINTDFTYHTYGQNFWNFPFERSQNWLPDVWQDLLFRHQEIHYRVKTAMVSSIAHQPFQKYCVGKNLKKLQDDFKAQTVEMLRLIRHMEESKLNSAEGTKHPSELGHKIWADYLYKYYSDL
jgi:hypothetical protein